MIGIYKITNPKGKIYIGQAIDIDKRWKQYYSLDKSCIGPIILNSLKKYKPENHIFDKLEECILEQLNERETYWKQYHIDLIGWTEILFCELYDNGGGPKSDKTKQKMSKTHQIHLIKPEILEKRLINCKKSSTPEANLKKIENTNWIERNKKLKNPRPRYIKIEKYTIDGKLLNEYFDVNIILNEFNNPKPQNLYACLKGLYKTWMGYKWKGYFS